MLTCGKTPRRNLKAGGKSRKNEKGKVQQEYEAEKLGGAEPVTGRGQRQDKSSVEAPRRGRKMNVPVKITSDKKGKAYVGR